MQFTYEIDPFKAHKPMNTYELVKADNFESAHEQAMAIFPEADYYMICCDLLGECGSARNTMKR